MDAVANGRNCVSLGAGNFCAAHAEKVPFIDAPLLGWGERSERFLQLSAALLLLLQVFGYFVVEQISFIDINHRFCANCKILCLKLSKRTKELLK